MSKLNLINMNANADRETVAKGKAFQKGEIITYFSAYADNAFYFRHAVVKSCGAKKMTLESLDGEMLGSNFEPSIGFTTKHGVGAWKYEHCFCSQGSFKKLSDEDAKDIAIELATLYKQERLEQMKRQVKRDNDENNGNETGYSRSMKQGIEKLEAKQIIGGELTEVRKAFGF